MFMGRMRTAGILEWIQTFLGCGYLFAFAGYLWAPQNVKDIPLDHHQGDEERRPLLQS